MIKFAQQYTSAHDTDEADDGQPDEGVKAAVHASQAGVKPPSAAGPFVSNSSQPSNIAMGQAVKKEL